MGKDTFKTKVIFRWWLDSVIAIFPELLGNNDLYTCSSYQRIGQHGSCNPYMIIRTSRPAIYDEYNGLYEELESIGYNLQIVTRNNKKYYQTRKNESRKIHERYLET